MAYGGCSLPERIRDWINQAKRDLASAKCDGEAAIL